MRRGTNEGEERQNCVTAYTAERGQGLELSKRDSEALRGKRRSGGDCAINRDEVTKGRNLIHVFVF